MSSWREWLKEGDQYQSAATPKFNTSFQYNVIGMALESYVMAILDYHKKLPDNHTFTDFIEALDSVAPLSENIKKRILQHEQLQRICSFTDYNRTEATQEQIDDFKSAVKEIGFIAHSMCIQ